MNLMPFAIAWGALALVVLALIIMRKSVAAKEDDTLHLSGDGVALVNQQMTVARKLEAIDKWGKILTVVLVVSGIALAVVYGIQFFEQGANVGFKE